MAFGVFFIFMIFMGVCVASTLDFGRANGGMAPLVVSLDNTTEETLDNANITQQDNVNMYFMMPESKVSGTVEQQLKGTGLLFLPYAPGSTFPESAAPKGIRDPGTLPEAEGIEKGLNADSGYLGGLR
jgi:hypothetical protein